MMSPIFTNPAGFYALLGIPIVIAIHFLQHKSKKITTSTLFLIEALTPESRTGKTWEHIRNSLALWMQILAVLLLAWVLVQPRWLQQNESQTVVFIVDDNLKMQPFKNEAIRAIQDDMASVKASGVPVQWVIMGSSSRKAPLYRGKDEGLALDALHHQWIPNKADHDPVPALRTAQSVIAKNGVSRFITCSERNIPPWQPAIGVGRVLDNVGFAGMTPDDPQQTGSNWRVAVKNNSRLPQTRQIEYRLGDRTVKQAITLNPNSVQEIQVSIPSDLNSVELRLNHDDFTYDDMLPIFKHTPKRLLTYADADEQTNKLINKITSSIPGAESSSKELAGLHISQVNTLNHTTNLPAIFLPAREQQTPAQGLVSAEEHPFTHDLSWGGLLVSKTGTLSPDNTARILLWKGEAPLAWIQQNALVLNWKWSSSNADRLPAAILLIRRYLEHVQSQSDQFSSGNLPAGSKWFAPGVKYMKFTPISGEQAQKPYAGFIPDQPGYIELYRNSHMDSLVYQGAVYQHDARQGDFSHCSSFKQGDLNQERIVENISSPDPFVPIWLALATGAVVLSWIPGKRERRDS